MVYSGISLAACSYMLIAAKISRVLILTLNEGKPYLLGSLQVKLAFWN